MKGAMKRSGLSLAAALALAALWASPASADFGLSQISVAFTEADGSPARQAGSHPFAMTTAFRVNTRLSPSKGVQMVDGALRNLDVILPAGLVGDATALPRCETLDFLSGNRPECADGTALGTLTAVVGGSGNEGEETVPVFNLLPAPGSVVRLGFKVAEQPITVSVAASQDAPYNAVASLRNASQATEVLSSELTIWGNPADPAHDADRGACAYKNVPGNCAAGVPNRPFLTLPRSCDGPLVTTFAALSWWSGDPLHPGPPASFEADAESPSMLNCSELGFAPQISAQPTSQRAESPSGLAVDLSVADDGLVDPAGRADSDIEAALLALPEGMTANPSLAEGLATCGPADLERETPTSAPGEGCPEASKVGTVEVQTPVLEGTVLHGALYIATPDDPATQQPGAENPFDSLLALYMVVKDPVLGILIRQPGLIEPDPRTGQLLTSFEGLPPFPLSQVHVALREGGRSPLITPPACGTHTSVAALFPSGDPFEPLAVASPFEIVEGVDGGPCPPPGVRPFDPGLSAGTVNPVAASYSPFHLRLTRRDGDQDLTRFDASLPPGVLAKLAGVSQCPDSAIAAAKAKTGRVELASPSCSAASRIGTVWGGAGVGSQLTYVPGSVYLAGPVGKAPLSVVGIVPAVAGPFDVGTVVVRQALRVDPVSGVVGVDGSLSDPIPHILAGIPLRVRDIRVDVDRPDFTLNPTDCSVFATTASIWGGGLDVFSVADDRPVSRAARFQAGNCASLAFRPRLSMTMKGGTSRGQHPAFRAAYRPRPGHANLSDLVVRLPRSAFLEQAHIRTICTRVQFAADACPKAAIYGHVTAHTPLLSEPLSGPVYLRSSNNELPDLVFDLHGLIDIEASARIDSIGGGIRATFANLPDAPLSKVVLRMRGARKGLVVNSRDLCAAPSRAKLRLTAQSAKRRALRVAVRPSGCGKGKR